MDLSSEKIVAFQHDLKKNFQGEMLFDRISRILYSTDASNFQIEPMGVVLPRNEDDICAIVEIAGRYSVPIIPRGSGSSMAGQTLGTGLVLDCSKYLNRIHEVDIEGRTAIVGPGVILEALNTQLESKGLMFGPDPASAERATIGGMVGNNATGAHSIRYGLTIDHVLTTDVVLSDGSLAHFEPLSRERFEQQQNVAGLEGKIYSQMANIREAYADVIKDHWPGTWRRASGYSLNYLLDFSPNSPAGWYEPSLAYPPTAGLNLAPIMVSSEGTLAILRKIKLNLVEQPKAKALAILPFKSVAEAADATPALLEHEPHAVELIPRTIFERAKAIPAYARRMSFLEGDPAAVLVVEFDGENAREATMKAHSLRGATVLESSEAMADLWAVRKVGLGLLMSIPGDTKPITFIEDVAVPVEHLGDFVRRVETILTANKTYGEWYAHASAGCLHLRPMINLKTSEGVSQMRDIAEAIIEITLSLHGSVSGEHGDGLSHTEYNERLFGPELMQAFREIKTAFDPQELLNPGKVIPASDGFGGSGSLTDNLRYGSEYSVSEPEVVFAHRREGGFAAAIEACTGVGVCRQENGLMCPSYQVTRDEIHTTRGRANVLRAAMSGLLPPESLTSDEMYQVLDLCLECKGCKAECPTAVDMARLKAEFLHQYNEDRGVPLRSRLFANIHFMASLARPLAGVVEAVSKSQTLRNLQQTFLGISKRRTIPSFSKQTFRAWAQGLSETMPKNQPRVILFVDTYTQFMQPEIGQDAKFVLEHLGYHIDVIEDQVCCGRPMISKGLLKQAKENAWQNIEVLNQAGYEDIPVVGIEPSCILTLRDEYLEFFPEDPRTKALADRAYLLEEFLVEPNSSGDRPIDKWGGRPDAPVARYHNHCYSKALVGSEAFRQLFKSIGVDAFEIPSGCCGMAGSFGYEEEHYDLSLQIAEQVLLPSVREGHHAAQDILAPGYSCRTQIRDGAEVEALHPVQYLANIIRNGPNHRTNGKDLGIIQ
jgi:FAD/FMN-containing dehydrogenase/Fe-S oxidoreductase